MKIYNSSIGSVLGMFLLSSAILIATGPYSWARAGEREVILFEEDFDDGIAQNWELEPGWTVTDKMLRGRGHHWALPGAGP